MKFDGALSRPSVRRLISANRLKSPLVTTLLLSAALTSTTTLAFAQWGGQFTQQQEVIGTNATGNLGTSVALSYDGRVALIAAPGQNKGEGAAFIYTKDGSTWTEQQGLTVSDCPATCYFGLRVALSGDGHVALLGAPAKNDQTGTAYIFTEAHGVWTQQQELTGSDIVPGDAFGLRVALNYDGRVALIGTGDNSAYIFIGNLSTWTQQQELTGAGEFGQSVALDSNGRVALVGAPGANSGAGAVYVFTENASGYALQQELTASNGVAGDQFGNNSVALSSDGQIALIGASNANSGAGAAYVFTYRGGTYTQQEELIASDASGNAQFGWSVALNGDGRLAVVGAWQQGPGGSAYIFRRQDDTYTQQQELTASDAGAYPFGFSVAVDSDGHTALIGAGTPIFAYQLGAAYFFTEQNGNK